MTAIEKIKTGICKLYEKGEVIHITITLTHPRINLKEAPAEIKGVYPHVFRVEEHGVPNPKGYTLQYTDLLTNNVKISEL